MFLIVTLVVFPLDAFKDIQNRHSSIYFQSLEGGQASMDAPCNPPHALLKQSFHEALYRDFPVSAHFWVINMFVKFSRNGMNS